MPSYTINPQHRDGNPNKSQWIVIESDEVSLFETSYTAGWKDEDDKKCFGIKKSGTSISILGVCKDRITDLKIAKFVSNHQLTWHGYPANYRINQQDKPTTTILEKWVEEELITKSKMGKIARGQKCNL